jgi:hypothetical protein
LHHFSQRYALFFIAPLTKKTATGVVIDTKANRFFKLMEVEKHMPNTNEALFSSQISTGAHCLIPSAARPAHSHSHVGEQARVKLKLYNLRHPEHTFFYKTIAEHFQARHELASAGRFDG